MSNSKVLVAGIGAYLPGDRISNSEIDDYLGSIPGQDLSKYYRIIGKFAGIETRHFAVDKHTGRLREDSPHLAYNAALKALQRAGLSGKDVDLIITTTTSPPYLRGGLSKELRLLLDNDGCATYDLWGACSGITQAITLATAGIRASMFENALLIGVELISTTGRAENYQGNKMGRLDMLLRAALGDGAGALILRRSQRPEDRDGILYSLSGTEGDEPSAFHREAGGSTLPLNQETFAQGLHHWQHDFERMVSKGRPYFLEIVKRCLADASMEIDDVDYIIPAAANFRYYREDDKLKNISSDQKMFVEKVRAKTFTNFSKVGNVPSAAIYLSLDELYETGEITDGTTLLLASVEGATWGWGASLLRWNTRSDRKGTGDAGGEGHGNQ